MSFCKLSKVYMSLYNEDTGNNVSITRGDYIENEIDKGHLSHALIEILDYLRELEKEVKVRK